MKRGILLLSFLFLGISSWARLPGRPVADTIIIDTAICDSGPFILPDGSFYPYVPGLNQDTLALAGDMDTAILLLTLEVLESPRGRIDMAACQGDTVALFGLSFTENSQLTQVLPAAGPCDSLVTYYIFFEPLAITFREAAVCRLAEVGADTLLFSGSNGCDSLVVIDTRLDTGQLAYELLLYETCPGDTLYIEGQAFTADTTWTTTLAGANGCDSIAETRLRFVDAGYVVLADIPTQMCPGENLRLIYGEDFFSRTANPFTFARTDSLPLPDGAGATYSAAITVDAFPEGAVIEDAADIEVCINIEHSWMHDLEIALRCPDNTVIRLQNQEFINNEVFLGIPFEMDDASPGPAPVPGTGYTYCWVADAPAGAWTEFSQANGTGGPAEYTLPPGDYAPAEPFSNLLGCPWNGEWRIEVTDLWASDNGYVFFWSVGRRNAAIDPAAVVARSWMDNPAAFIAGDTLAFTADEPGAFAFTYILQDTSGCVYDTTFTVEVLPSYVDTLDITLCPGGMLNGVPIDTPLVLTAILATEAGCDSIVNYQVSLFAADTSWLSAATCIAAQAGFSIIILVDANGCDSTIITEVAYLPPADTATVARITCDPLQEDEYLVLPGGDGCDSIVFSDYTYQELDFGLTIMPDRCREGVGGLEVELFSNPNYNNIGIALFGLSPPAFLGSGPSYSGLPAGLYKLEIRAGAYCELAEEVVVPNTGGEPPLAAFTYTADSTAVSFLASPLTGELPSYNWAFGDGGGGSGLQAWRQYAYPGLYEACLTVENQCGQDTSCDEVFLPFRIEMPAAGGPPGPGLTLPVTVNGAFRLGQLDAALWFLSPEVVQIDSLTPFALGTGNFFEYEILGDAGYVTVGWASLNPPGITLEPSDTLFLIHLTLLGQPGARCDIVAPGPPSAYFYLEGQLAGPYNASLSDSEVFVTMGTGSREAQAAGRLLLFQNQPNPFGEETGIPFFLPEACEAELLITGPLGRVVERHRQYYPAGRHTYVFRREGRQAAGLYTYSLRTPYGMASRRMALGK